MLRSKSALTKFPKLSFLIDFITHRRITLTLFLRERERESMPSNQEPPKVGTQFIKVKRKWLWGECHLGVKSWMWRHIKTSPMLTKTVKIEFYRDAFFANEMYSVLVERLYHKCCRYYSFNLCCKTFPFRNLTHCICRVTILKR